MLSLRCSLRPPSASRRAPLTARGANKNKTRATADVDPPAPLRADIRVKIGIAAGSGKLDLSDCDLDFVPNEVFEIEDLIELSLAGNNLTALPDSFGKLTSLEKLQLSGNRLKSLPDSLCELESLEGLWLHGNLLECLPTNIGLLLSLKQLAVAGNRLARLPDSIGLLTSLVELVVAGNRLEALPSSIGTLSACRVLDLHGNRLSSVPDTVGLMESLEELWLQGNPTLQWLPKEIGRCHRLQKLSVADCGLVGIPAEIGGLEALLDISAYGNSLKMAPVNLLGTPIASGEENALPMKRKVWLEGNPLSADTVRALVDAAQSGAGSVGLDETQLASLRTDTGDESVNASQIIASTTVPNAQGYFKLERHPGAHANEHYANGFDPADRHNDVEQLPSVLIVAFGSAPGTPNWGGALRRVRKDLDASTVHADVSFDILYVVDPERSWYHGGDERFREYDEVIAGVAAGYSHVLYVGDSMGATACLLFAKHADVVHAFCPQIDLSTSSIRPGEDSDWELNLKQRALDGIDSCTGQLYVHVGNWQHDIQQVHAVQAEHALVKIYGVDSHRLAIALERSGKLTRILEESVLKFYGRMSSEGLQRVNGYL